MKTVVVAFGTRPEAIKMAPIILALKQDKSWNCIVLSTGQHREMLASVLDVFGLKPDVDLEVMAEGQGLAGLTATIVQKADVFFKRQMVDLVLVHGDTTTSFGISLAAFYNKIEIGHVEAGLRTHDLYSPWPEEANRQLNTVLAKWHFVPTEQSRQNLLRESIPNENISVCGNTVIDALKISRQRIVSDQALLQNLKDKYSYLTGKKMILVTGHRRENFGQGFEEICKALALIATRNDVQIIYPVHLNPNVLGPVKNALTGVDNIKLIEPVGYLDFIYLMECSFLILTDSGGVQEEAPSLGKPVLVMRENTERPEAVVAGTVKLVGAKADNIVKAVELLLVNSQEYQSMAKASNPYGDGNSSSKIIEFLSNKVLKK